ICRSAASAVDFRTFMATAHPRNDRMTWRDQACLLEELGMLGWDALRQAGDASLAAHRHRGAFEICLIVRGSVEWWVRRGSRTEIHVVEPGCVYLTRPGEVHGGVDAVLHACELYWLHLRSGEGELPGMSRGQARSLFQRLRGLPRTFRAAPAVQRGMEALVAEHVDPDAWKIGRAH